MELHWITSQVEEPGKVGEGRFGKEDNGLVLDTHKFAVPVRHTHACV